MIKIAVRIQKAFGLYYSSGFWKNKGKMHMLRFIESKEGVKWTDWSKAF